ncbi:hypothetical protein SK069_05875 [Patulibacter brassicae]|uniref:Uncharacterized protein n=1 Tax=Patulibacter brassicae TaxID=1705717 RepID=A0ABU4VJN6_9ACTN|nr:hypothetical protein [Patulibacter brassicae]MDX8151113.1 hypothetical protein [Patulibacter brassicae]
MSRGQRTLACIDCGTTWEWRGQVRRDVRCPACRLLAQRRAEIQQHLEQLVTTDHGARIAAVALAAASRAQAGHPGRPGSATLAHAIHAVARSGAVDEATRQARLLDVASAAVLWAAEIAGALDG